MISISQDTTNRFLTNLQAFELAELAKSEKKSRLLSLIEVLLQKKDALPFLYEYMPRLAAAGIFENTVWEKPENLVPGLVGGTLLAPFPTAIMELLSELRLLAIAEGRIKEPQFTKEEAFQFLKLVLVKNLDYVAEDFSALSWKSYAQKDLKKIRFLFDFLLEKMPLESLKAYLHDEITTQAAIRPILDHKLKNLLTFVHQKLDLDRKNPVDNKLLDFTDALFSPTEAAKAARGEEAYNTALKSMDDAALESECLTIGNKMRQTSVVSFYQFNLLKFVGASKPALVPVVLCLNDHGKVEYQRHQELILLLINDYLTPAKQFAVYGLARALERNLFSQKIALNAFNRLLQIKINPRIAQQLQKGNFSTFKASPLQLLISGALCVLGQPLSIRQGNNPTCQSARGISMWSRHAPGKLLNLLIDAATTNNLIFRYKSSLIESAKTSKGLVHQLDYKLDPVSIVLVPHLDKIYNEMMLRASFQHPEEDPHAQVNPAFYGHWIQTGFLSVFNSVKKVVDNFEVFVRTFYASFHPEYNGGHQLAYPVPLGIFITNSSGTLQGFHAISLLRIDLYADKGQWRAYFFNPNSEGDQEWGQGIRPTVNGNGERHGESSLPVYQFVARLYAYHYNKLRMEGRLEQVPENKVQQVEKLAKESWGRSYRWSAG